MYTLSHHSFVPLLALFFPVFDESPLFLSLFCHPRFQQPAPAPRCRFPHDARGLTVRPASTMSSQASAMVSCVPLSGSKQGRGVLGYYPHYCITDRSPFLPLTAICLPHFRPLAENSTRLLTASLTAISVLFDYWDSFSFEVTRRLLFRQLSAF